MLASSSRDLRTNFMSALSDSARHSPATAPLSSPESSPRPYDGHASSSSDDFTFEMSDLMLPASAFESEIFGVPRADSGATVVSTSTLSSDDSHPASPDSSNTSVKTSTTSRSRKQRKSSASSERRHSLPSSLLLSQTPLGDTVTQPVPEFLCHLFSMLRDPSYSELISWEVPLKDESEHQGGGIRGIGKIVVHKPESLQDHVLGKYYRHSKYASFQRQLNYFGFKKRLHGGKKGKLSPCSYIHERLTDDVGSLFALKRRPPSKKRASEEDGGDEADVESTCGTEETTSFGSITFSGQSSKKRRITVDKMDKKSKKDGKKDKKDKKKSNKKRVVITSMPVQVCAEEYGPPSVQSSFSSESNQCQPQQVSSAPSTNIEREAAPQPQAPLPFATPSNTAVAHPSIAHSNTAVVQQSVKPQSLQAAQPTLLELLSTSLPPSDELFNDELDMDSMDDEGAPAWVTDDGKYHYHNVDSSLVDLAMLY